MYCFCDNYNLKSLIKQPTCYKNPDNSTWIDLLLTNVLRSLESICLRNRAVRFSFNEFDCYEKKIQEVTT